MLVALIVVYGCMFFYLVMRYSFSSSLTRRHPVVSIDSFYPATETPLHKQLPIPLVIHQMLSKRKLSSLMVQQLLHHNHQKAPEFAFRYYDDEDMEAIIKDHFPSRVFEAYRRIHPSYGACRSDFGRYAILYVYGGLYLDIKSEILKSPLPLLEKYAHRSPLLLGGHWEDESHHSDTLGNTRGEIMNWVLGSTPGHPVLWELIMDMSEKIELGVNGRGKQFVLELTGPVALTRVVLEKGKQLVTTTNTIHSYFEYNSERCGAFDCRSVYYLNKIPYDKVKRSVITTIQ